MTFKVSKPKEKLPFQEEMKDIHKGSFSQMHEELRKDLSGKNAFKEEKTFPETLTKLTEDKDKYEVDNIYEEEDSKQEQETKLKEVEQKIAYFKNELKDEKEGTDRFWDITDKITDLKDDRDELVEDLEFWRKEK